ncbi:hypothetical protein JW835_13565 [bacterium]|nr:hypothetical protein [bacterium]
MINRKKILVSLIVLFTIQGMATDIGRGGMAGSFLRMGIGARMLGMGGGSAALTDDGHTLYYNPAGLVFLQDRWITLALHNMALDRHLMFLGYAQSIGREEQSKRGMLRGGFGLGWLSAGVNDIDQRDENGTHQGTLSHGEHCFYFSFAVNPHSRFSVGLSGKLLYSRFPDIAKKGGAFSSAGFGFDFGVVFRPLSTVTFGAALRDVRTRLTWNSQEVYDQGIQVTDYFPKVMQLGLAWRGLSEKMILHADYQKIEDMPGIVLSGMEYTILSQFFLRMGIDDKEPAFGLGCCGEVFSKGFRLDYAYVSDPVAPRNNHVMTCAFYF